MISLPEIKQRILEGERIEEIIEEIDWREFEELVSEIFQKHDFKTYHNFRFKTKRRYEIDIIAVRNDIILLIDCKQWSKGRYKKSALKQAVKTQVQRTREFEKFLKNNLIARKKLRIKSEKFIPLIITWLEENLIEHKNTFIIPVWKLNLFLLNLSSYV